MCGNPFFKAVIALSMDGSESRLELSLPSPIQQLQVLEDVNTLVEYARIAEASAWVYSFHSINDQYLAIKWTSVE
jgi:hypothetical protein